LTKVQVEQEERRRTLQKELETQKEKSRYDDHLAKDRIEYRLQREKQTQDENLKKQEESIKKQESMKRATLEYEHELKLKSDRERFKQKANMKAELERKNFDLVEKKLRIIEGERRITAMQQARIYMEYLGYGVKEFINDKKMYSKVVVSFLFAFLVGYAGKSGINMFFQLFASRFLTPKLVKETSRISFRHFYRYPFMMYNRMYGKHKDIMKGIILKNELDNQLRVISNAIINRKKHYAPFRNLLFYGPPGTGKTLFAKQLAKQSGLDFAILTGADVAPLGTMAVLELNKLFDWAETSSNGLLIFIDESDAFLRRRAGDELISENLRNAINTFLYRTGTSSTKYLIVLATNTPQLLDEAIQDRIDEMVNFEKPLIKERFDILNHYLDKYCNKRPNLSELAKMVFQHPSLIWTTKKQILLQIEKEYIDDVALRTEGFSARELSKLVISWHDEAFSKSEPTLNRELAEHVLERNIIQFRMKSKWNTTQSEYFKIMHSKNKL
jgi:ATPase family AAA domain-containing protein 3A/B